MGLLRPAPTSRYLLMAAISASHATAAHFDATDWRQIVMPLRRAHAVWPSPIVALNQAIAVGRADGPFRDLRAVALGAVSSSARSHRSATRLCRRLGELG